MVRTPHGAVVEQRLIAAGTDLKRLFVTAMLEWIERGWRVGEFSSCAGTFFCSRGVERRTVTIQSTDPGSEHGHGGSRLLSP